MTRPSPREVHDDPIGFRAFLTQPSDDKFEGQHFDRKEAGNPQLGTINPTTIDNLRDLVIKTVSAFANSNQEGGLLVLGISSKGEITGVDHLNEQQRNNITDLNKLLVHHAASIRFKEITDVAGKPRTLCFILSAYSTSGICETIGNNPRAWTRNGSQCIQITQAVRDSLRRLKGLVSFEIDPVCEYSRDEIDNDILAEFRKVFEPASTANFSDDRLLKEAGAIVRKDDKFWFTMPGILFFASNPQRVYAHAYIRLLRFGVASGEFRSRGTPTLDRDFKGPVTTQIRAARTFLRESGFFKRFQKRSTNGGFIEEPELPGIAIDEAIVNAVAHRDYSVKLPIECEAYLDAFVVKNPGRVIQRNVDLPNLFSLDTTALDSTPRNAKLLEWLKLMRDPEGRAFVQAVSEGTKRMTAEMLILGLPPPRFRLLENESILTLQSNAQEREATMLAAAKVTSTETLNFFLLTPHQSPGHREDEELRDRQQELLESLKASLQANDWYIDRSSFSRTVVHRRGNELSVAPAARAYLRLYPGYILQLQECFGRLYLCVDYHCEVLNIRRLNLLLGHLSRDTLVERNCVVQGETWRQGRIVEVRTDWTVVHFFDTEATESVASSEVIPSLSTREVEAVLRAEKVEFDLHAAVKAGSLSSGTGGARLRAEKILEFIDVITKGVFPLRFGSFEVHLSAKPVELIGYGSRGPVRFIAQRLNEPAVEFRDHHSSPDVRDGITKFGSFDANPHRIEVIPVCVSEYRTRMDKLLAWIMEGKFKYRGSERTFATRFNYSAVVTASTSVELDTEISRLLTQNPEWCGANDLRRLFLVQCPEDEFSIDDERSPYYVIKRRLLEAGIPCQMVDSPTLNQPDFKDLNLALNIIAKCGITPWVLPESIPEADFFVGLSYTQSRDGQRIMGFANVFNSYGRWVFYAGNTTTFDASKRPEHLAALAQATLEKLRAQHSLADSARLILHHSLRISRDDRTAILRGVRSVAPDASVTFVWVNGHGNGRLFDAAPGGDGSVRRGSYVTLSRRRLLLSTTGNNPYRKAMGTPRPLELSALHFAPRADDPSDYDRRSLALQVLSLTKLNWASTDAFCGEPITVKYAGDIAYLTAAFLRQREPFTLHPVLERTPWFI
jgi:predicted HTH transcriptional regulator